MKRLVLIITVTILSVQLSWGKIHPAAGTTSAQFLKLGIGARAIGMGQAFVAVADDATAPEWNPAGSSNMLYKQITAMHHIHFQDITQDYISYIQPTDDWSWGLTARGLFYPKDLERRSGLGEDIPEQPLTQYTDKFGGHDVAVTANFSKAVRGTINGGINVKFIRQKIDVKTGSSFAFDLGLLSIFPETWHKPFNDMSWGVAVQNIGPGIKFVERSYDLPLNFKGGLAYRPLEDVVTIALDYNHSIDNYPYISAGVEWIPVELLRIRAGYRYKYYGNDLGELSGVHAGIGIYFLKESSVDYSFMPQGDLGNTHRMSLTLSFGKPKKIKHKKLYMPKEVEIKSLVFKKAQVWVKPTKMFQRKVYADMKAELPKEFAIRDMSCKIIYQAGAPKSPVNIEVTKEEDVDQKFLSQLPRNAKIYEIISLYQNLDRFKRGDIHITFAVDKKWIEKNNVKVSNIFIVNADGHQSHAVQTDETKTAVVFKASITKPTNYLILFAQ